MSGPELPEDSKLTRTKRRWAEEGRFLTGHEARPEADRLPPGQHLVTNWPVLDLGQQPVITTENWTLDIGGEVDRPLHWNWGALLAQPQSTKLSDIHCVTSWSRFDNNWAGVATLDLLDAALVREAATHVLFTCADGYTTNMAIGDFASPQAILAHSWQGQPLAPEHGGPLRLVVPHLYFWKSPKWLSRMEFVTADRRGFWEVRGYHNHADPWREERYSQD